MERNLSPETTDFLERLREHYRQQGKTAAAANYIRHLRGFFAWAEGMGFNIKTLPPTSVEDYLSSTGQKETTNYVMRTQIKSALREAHAALGTDFAHLEYQTGKPKAVRDAQKAREKEKKAAARQDALVLPFLPVPAAPSIPPQEYPMSEATEALASAPPAPAPAAPSPTPVAVAGAANAQQPIVVMMPQQAQQRPAAPAAQPQKPAQPAQQAQRGVTINNHTFTGAFVKISRVADGSEPFVPPGTETFITTLPASQLLPHGDVAAFLQQFIVPGLRLPPTTGQVSFVFHELNDRRQPTGRRDELVVAVPMGSGFGVPQQGQAPQVAPQGFGYAPQAPAPGFDPATTMLLKRFDEESAAAKAKAEKLAEELAKAKDSTTQIMLAQMMQREQDNARRFEEQRFLAIQQASAAASMPMPAPTPVVEVAKPDPTTEFMKAMAEGQARAAEAQSRMMEALMVRLATPPAPVQQKDTMEVMIPFITAMNAQMMQQQQSNQQMLLGVQQASQQFMQALITRESPEVKLLRDELREVRAAANAPKGDDIEEFAEKFQKIKVVGEMVGGGGGGGGGGLIESIIANMDTIGAGIAKVVSASRPAVTLPTAARPQLAQAPAPQLPAPQAQAVAQEAAPSQVDISPVIAHLNAAAEAASKTEPDEQKTIDSIVEMVKTLHALPEPYPNLGKRIMTALQQVEDDDDLFMVAKHLWVAVNQKPDKAAARSIANVFYKWFPLIHMNLFGSMKYLAGQSEAEFTKLLEVPSAEGEGSTEAASESDADAEADDESGDDGVIETQADVAGVL